MLDDSFDGTSTELRVVAFVADEVQRLIREFQFHTVVLDHLLDLVELQADNLLDFIFGQRREHDDFVDTVQELRANGLLQELQDLRLRMGKAEPQKSEPVLGAWKLDTGKRRAVPDGRKGQTKEAGPECTSDHYIPGGRTQQKAGGGSAAHRSFDG